MQHEVVQEPELAVGEVAHDVAEARLTPCEVEDEAPAAERGPAVVGVRAPQLDADAREQLVERNRLRHVVRRSELEPAELRRQVSARREDEDRQLRPAAVQRVEHVQPVEAGQHQVEEHEIPLLLDRANEAVTSVARSLDSVSLRFETAREKRENPSLVLDYQDLHPAAPRG